MSAREFLTNVSIILVVMAAGAALESIAPLFAGRSPTSGRRTANLGMTAVSFASNWALGSASAVAALAWRPAGLFAATRWPLWAQTAVGIVILDFSIGYLSHRTMHMWPAMWRFHSVHHSDSFVDVTTTYRTHPVETVWRFLFGIVPIWILGLPAGAVLIQRLLQATNGIIEHANIRLWGPIDRWLSLVWVTPNVHKIHHSREVSETNSNYANLLTVYDRLLGTYTPSTRARSVAYGLDGEGPLHETVPLLMTMPFLQSGREAVPDGKVSVGAAASR